ncbi:hypothetical protein LTA6_003120 [Microbacterium sp. LTA6]|uniref:hypothetical protein n=1 Tax=unclassified Microbacterium TaxID=2609290 RepID=UPI003139643A
MAGRGSKNDQRARAAAERARLYTARSEWHQGQERRRVRDNIVAGVAGGLLIAGVIASQVVHAQVTAPEPEPTQSIAPTPSETPVETPAPIPSDTPAETPAP